MAAHICPRCGEQRARRRHSLCTICSFRDDLVREHNEGLHDRLNVSCDVCKPKHLQQLREGAAGTYVRRVIAEKPLTPALAKFVLRLDRDGLQAATRLGERGSRALERLRRQGHVEIEWHGGVPLLRVSALTRHKALELLARGNDATSPVEKPRDELSARRASSSHASCTHERTSKARAKCRAERRGAK